MDNDEINCGHFLTYIAFDIVNHDILLKKLDHYGFRGIVLDWFRSYLTGRKQKVVINGFESKSEFLNHGGTSR